MKNIGKNLIIWIIITVFITGLLNALNNDHKGATPELSYSAFIDGVKGGAYTSVTLTDNGRNTLITGQTLSGQRFKTIAPHDLWLISDLLQNKIDFKVRGAEPESPLWTLFVNWFPMLLLIGLWVFFMKGMNGGGAGGAMSFGKSKARMLSEDQVKVTFADVAGCEEAKEEVKELVDFLKDPTKFQKIGGKIPRGVLMAGPPGTGKTLLARAIAGEAKVPFFTISGSDFVEMFVGVGASRVRDLFAQAKKNAPCIIFIDEIDAVGRKRGSGMGGGNDEREQTLNQMLVEMDGFEDNEGVIVIAATNRPDVLDPALLRPGRFDRQVTVGLPDIIGREQILKVHMRKLPLAGDVKPSIIARGTPGFSGADLANLANEAALFAARANKKLIDMDDMEKAKDKIMMGAERKSMAMKDSEKLLTAYHEAGHAIVGLKSPSHDPVYKVSIIPRGRALGVTMFLPEEDRYSHSKEHLESQIASLYGGRLAEEIIFGADAVTTGASNDIMRATEIARNMVTKWGLSERLGPLDYGTGENHGFLGNSEGKSAAMSEETALIIDEEIRAFCDTNYQRAKTILDNHMTELHAMTDALMKYETIDSSQIEDIMAGNEVKDPKGWHNDDDSELPPSDDNNTASEETDIKEEVKDNNNPLTTAENNS